MSITKPTISVVLPVYNVENYLDECFQSLLNQTYQDFEVIVVNDGSTDNSLAIVEKYESQFDHFMVITQNNRGLSEARNTGITQIKGTYTYFLDSDDYIAPDTFENLVGLAMEHDLDVIKFDAEPFSTEGITFKESKYDSSQQLQEGTLYSKDAYVTALKKRFMPTVWLLFIKTSIIKENNLTFKKGILHEDELFTVQLLSHCNRIMYDASKYFKRRYRQQSIMTSSIYENKKSLESKLEVIRLFDEMEQQEVSDAFRSFLKQRKAALFTTILFHKHYSWKDASRDMKRLHVAISAKGFLREIKNKVK